MSLNEHKTLVYYSKKESNNKTKEISNELRNAFTSNCTLNKMANNAGIRINERPSNYAIYESKNLTKNKPSKVLINNRSIQNQKSNYNNNNNYTPEKEEAIQNIEQNETFKGVSHNPKQSNSRLQLEGNSNSDFYLTYEVKNQNLNEKTKSGEMENKEKDKIIERNNELLNKSDKTEKELVREDENKNIYVNRISSGSSKNINYKKRIEKKKTKELIKDYDDPDAYKGIGRTKIVTYKKASSTKEIMGMKTKSKLNESEKKNEPKRFHIKDIKAISRAGKKDTGVRKTNQDTYLAVQRINDISQFNVFGVLDGTEMMDILFLNMYLKILLKN